MIVCVTLKAYKRCRDNLIIAEESNLGESCDRLCSGDGLGTQFARLAVHADRYPKPGLDPHSCNLANLSAYRFVYHCS